MFTDLRVINEYARMIQLRHFTIAISSISSSIVLTKTDSQWLSVEMSRIHLDEIYF